MDKADIVITKWKNELCSAHPKNNINICPLWATFYHQHPPWSSLYSPVGYPTIFQFQFQFVSNLRVGDNTSKASILMQL